MYHQYIILDESINVEDNEKLRATVADNEVYIHVTEIEEEKKKVEEQYLKEKQITKGSSIVINVCTLYERIFRT